MDTHSAPQASAARNNDITAPRGNADPFQLGSIPTPRIECLSVAPPGLGSEAVPSDEVIESAISIPGRLPPAINGRPCGSSFPPGGPNPGQAGQPVAAETDWRKSAALRSTVTFGPNRFILGA
jgi:hypothetical protein